jgi:cellulose 1,4-beta-cellobiosidase
MGTFLGNIQALNAAGANPPVAGTFAVYDLPDRDCAAAASNGEYTIADNGVANYFAYIDAIKALLVTYSDVKVILIIGQSCVEASVKSALTASQNLIPLPIWSPTSALLSAQMLKLPTYNASSTQFQH